MAKPAILFVMLILLAVTGYFFLDHRNRPSDVVVLQAGTALPEPRPLADFELVDQSGKPFGRNQLKGTWNLLFLGFTHCPDVCPQTLAVLSAIDNRRDPHDARVQTVFVSVDPERDTPSHLAEYTAYFNPEFAGVTGEKPELDRLCDSLDFAYVKVPQGEGRYTVDHSTPVALIDPQARVVGYFSQPLDIEAVAADLRALP